MSLPVLSQTQEPPPISFVQIGSFLLAPPAVPPSLDKRLADVSLVGAKACGLALIPHTWSPPFFVVSALAFEAWLRGDDGSRSALLNKISQSLIEHCVAWETDWSAGLVLRSSAVRETIKERGAYESVPTTADYGNSTVSSALENVYRSFLATGDAGNIAVVVQARVNVSAVGHMSNERRVSATVNQWAWETEGNSEAAGRFNSQRSSPPDERKRLNRSGIGLIGRLKSFLQRVGRWCTELGDGPCHLEWGVSGDTLWLFQLDFEDDQPDQGVDPRKFSALRATGPAADPPQGCPFIAADFEEPTGWPKIDKVRNFLTNRTLPYPRLFFATGDQIIESSKARDIAADIRCIGADAVVVRTDYSGDKIDRLNLPRTDTVTADGAMAFIELTVNELGKKDIEPSEICFILHKFIPALSGAWALAHPSRQIVLVDSLWGVPDGLQYLSHDTFEYDVRRKEVSSENLRYKPHLFQELASGEWELVRVARRLARHRSLSSPDLREVAETTFSIASQLGKPVQVMWFCEIHDGVGIGRNVPWFMLDPESDEPPQLRTQVAPTLRSVVVRTEQDLPIQPRDKFLMVLEPEANLFRDTNFLAHIADYAVANDIPIELRGSTLSHAFYVLQRKGVAIVGAEVRRTRQRQLLTFAKLVRDEIPDRIKEQGELVVTAQIAKSQSRAALVSKLHEEAQELLQAVGPEDVRAELADVLEVVRSLCVATGVNWTDVEAAAEAKRASRGSFERGVVLLKTSWPAWKDNPKSEAKLQIDFAELKRFEKKGTTCVANFPLLVMGGVLENITLSDGSALRVRLGTKGLEVEIIPPEDKNRGQLKLF